MLVTPKNSRQPLLPANISNGSKETNANAVMPDNSMYRREALHRVSSKSYNAAQAEYIGDEQDIHLGTSSELKATPRSHSKGDALQRVPVPALAMVTAFVEVND